MAISPVMACFIPGRRNIWCSLVAEYLPIYILDPIQTNYWVFHAWILFVPNVCEDVLPIFWPPYTTGSRGNRGPRQRAGTPGDWTDSSIFPKMSTNVWTNINYLHIEVTLHLSSSFISFKTKKFGQIVAPWNRCWIILLLTIFCILYYQYRLRICKHKCVGSNHIKRRLTSVHHSYQWNIETKLFSITFHQGVYFTVHSLGSIRTNFQLD